MNLWGMLRILLVAVLAAAIAIVGLRLLRRVLTGAGPQTLQLVIPRIDALDGAILRAFAAELRDKGLKPAINLVEVADSREAARLLTIGGADLAVVRPDVEMPTGASAIVRLRSVPLILATRKGVEMSRLADLEGRIVGTDDRDAGVINDVNAIFAQTQRMPANRRPVQAAEIETLLTKKQVDVVLFTPSLAQDRAGPALLRKLAAPNSGFKVSAVVPDDVSGLTTSLPAIPIAESGLPGALRVDDVEEVVSAQFLLLARNALPSSVVATFTERMYSMRPAIAKRAGRPAPFGQLTDENVTANTIPVHKGAIEYYEREQKTFVERYSDEIWIGIALSGMASSTLAWFGRGIRRRRRIHISNVINDLMAFAQSVRSSPDAEALAVHEQQFDALAVRVVELARKSDLDEAELAGLRFARDHANDALNAARLVFCPARAPAG